MTKKALKLALEALKEAQTNDDGLAKWARNKKAIIAIKEALAQPEQEPVAWMSDVGSVASAHEKKMGYVLESAFTIPLYTTPPQRTWVGLEEEEVQELRYKIDVTAHWTYDDFAQAIEAKLKDKNK